MSPCARCQRVYPLGRVRYRMGAEVKRTRPLCLECRHAARRLVYRNGGVVLETLTDRAS